MKYKTLAEEFIKRKMPNYDIINVGNSITQHIRDFADFLDSQEEREEKLENTTFKWIPLYGDGEVEAEAILRQYLKDGWKVVVVFGGKNPRIIISKIFS